MKAPDVDQFLEWVRTVAKLKETKRRGWQELGLMDAESVADHTFMTCMLAYLLAPYAGVDRNRAVVLALIHDVPEATVGDITPREMNPRDKRKLEAGAARELSAGLAEPQLLRDWNEVDSGDSAEAKFVRELDRLELVLQASIYEAQDGFDGLSEFHASAKKGISSPLGIRLLDRIVNSKERLE